MKKICLLGSTGSIGKQTIEIINENPKDFSLVGVSCGQNINELRNILKTYSSITSCCVKNKKDYLLVKEEFKNVNFFFGDEGLLELISDAKPDMVVNALYILLII